MRIKQYYIQVAYLGLLFILSCREKSQPGQPAARITSPANLDSFQNHFYLGAHLCREPMPDMDELKKDMRVLKQNGFNMVKLQEQWAFDEPEEGHYNFSKYEELISYAKNLGMYVYLGLSCEEAPAWLFKKFPDCRMVGQDGATIVYEAQSPMPADGKPGPCFDHPGAREAQRKFITKLVEALGKYDNLVVWNTWQEIGYWSDRLVGKPVCYCPNTINAFHEWLKQKYGSLDKLNKQWKTNYASWDYIQSSRNYKQHFTLPQTINWNHFIDNVKIGNTLRDRADAIRAADSLNRPVFAHLGSWNIGSGSAWTYARCQDFLGSSSYPASDWGEFNDWDDAALNDDDKINKFQSLKEEMWRMLALRFDYLRSSNVPGHPVWAAELQGGPLSTGFDKGRVPSADDIRRWMLTALGSGVNAISYWVTRAEIMAPEANGYSLLDSEGDSTERLSEASRIGRALIRHQDIFGKPNLQGSEVALLVDEDNFQFCADMPKASEHLEFSTRGWHRLLWDAGIPVDFLEASQLDKTGLKKYKAIVMPFPLSVSDEKIQLLTQYVNEGGNLISEAAVGRFTQNAFANRGEISKAAAALFGVRQKSFTMVREPGNGHRWSFTARTWGEFRDATMLNGAGNLEGLKTRANVYLQTFEPTDSKPCLYAGDQVAGTIKQLGKGRAWLFGTYVGHSGTAYRDSYTPTLVKSLMKQCSIVSGHEGQLLLRKRIIKGSEAWVITNPTDHQVTESFKTSGWKTASDLMDRPVAIRDGSISVTVGSLDVAVIIVK